MWVWVRLTPWIGVGVALTLGCQKGASQSATEPAPSRALVVAATSPSASPSASKTLPMSELTWEFTTDSLGRMRVVVVVPERVVGQRFPVLVAMHGRGEAFKGPERGARGWVDDYQLLSALERLQQPPLTRADFGGAVADARLEQINARLGRDPYQGLIVVCPYTPDILAGARAFSAAEPLAGFIVDQLLPRVFKETPASATPGSVGIDGVSLGGRAALLVGFRRPKAFGVVGSLQAAIDQKEIPRLVELARQARLENPKLGIRLLTSEQDYFRRELSLLSREFQAVSLSHYFALVSGDHSYEFNRGPGALEMLTFHDWVLRGRAPVTPESAIDSGVQ